MKRFAQVDAGVVTGVIYAEVAPAVLPAGRTFVEITARPDVTESSTFVAGVFQAPVRVQRRDPVLDRLDAIATKLGVVSAGIP